MKKSLLLLSGLFIISNASPVFAQDEDRIEELKSQISVLQTELAELESNKNAIDPDGIIGVIEKDKYILVVNSLDYSVSKDDKPLLVFNASITNKDDEPIYPDIYFRSAVDVTQATDVEEILLRGSSRVFSDDFEPELVKNAGIRLIPDATIDFVIGYEVEIDGSEVFVEDDSRKEKAFEFIVNPDEYAVN